MSGVVALLSVESMALKPGLAAFRRDHGWEGSVGVVDNVALRSQIPTLAWRKIVRTGTGSFNQDYFANAKFCRVSKVFYGSNRVSHLSPALHGLSRICADSLHKCMRWCMWQI